MTLPAEYAYMTFYATSIGNYGYEHISVWVGTTPDITAMTEVMADTAVDYNTTSAANYGKYMVDLSDYVGQTVYVAFNHANCTDIFLLGIDQVEFFGYGEDVPPVTVLLGDVDDNGVINFTDISVLYAFLLGNASLSEQGLLNADFNQDGSITFTDISSLYGFLVGA